MAAFLDTLYGADLSSCRTGRASSASYIKGVCVAGAVCRDGTILAPNSTCNVHGGVNAGSSPAAPSRGH